jgi:flavorubredoxin
VKPIWDLLSSLAVVNIKDKLGAAFGSYGWTGEAVSMLEDRLRGLKLRVPVTGVRVKLIPTEDELDKCRLFGRQLAEHLTGRNQRRVIDMSELFKEPTHAQG